MSEARDAVAGGFSLGAKKSTTKFCGYAEIQRGIGNDAGDARTRTAEFRAEVNQPGIAGNSGGIGIVCSDSGKCTDAARGMFSAANGELCLSTSRFRCSRKALTAIDDRKINAGGNSQPR